MVAERLRFVLESAPTSIRYFHPPFAVPFIIAVLDRHIVVAIPRWRGRLVTICLDCVARTVRVFVRDGSESKAFAVVHFFFVSLARSLINLFGEGDDTAAKAVGSRELR